METQGGLEMTVPGGKLIVERGIRERDRPTRRTMPPLKVTSRHLEISQLLSDIFKILCLVSVYRAILSNPMVHPVCLHEYCIKTSSVGEVRHVGDAHYSKYTW